MKVTALLLFLILLIVLVVSVIIGKSVWKEGFISYKKSSNSTPTTPYNVTILTYSDNKPVTKLFVSYTTVHDSRCKKNEGSEKFTIID